MHSDELETEQKMHCNSNKFASISIVYINIQFKRHSTELKFLKIDLFDEESNHFFIFLMKVHSLRRFGVKCVHGK